MNYTLHQLQILISLSETESITETAELLYLTQPAISLQLKKFQAQFDIPLVETIGKRIYITEFGMEIVKIAREIVSKMDDIDTRMKEYQNRLVGRLSLSVVSTGKYVMPYFVSKFINENEGVNLVMDVTNKVKVIEDVRNNRVDFALVSTIPSGLMVNKLELLKNELFLVTGAIHKKKRVTDSTLTNYPFILREEGSGTRQAMEMFLSKNKIKLNKRIVLTSNEAVKQAVIAGLGYSIMPRIGIKNELSTGDIKKVDFKGLPIRTNWCLIWPKGKVLSPISKAFIEFIRENKESIIKEKFKGL